MTQTTPEALRDMLVHASGIARGAGAILLEGYAQFTSGGGNVTFKQADVDPVTEYDQRSEAFIVAALRKAYPSHRIIGEEGGSYEVLSSQYEVPSTEHQSLGTQNSELRTYEWQIDPLDGTVNFAHGFPVFSVSIGLLVNGVPALGVVYDPVHDEMFVGATGLGAMLNGKPIHVSRTPTLSLSLLTTGFPYDSRTSAENNFAAFYEFQRKSQQVRRLGSAALDLSYVACGRLDGYWEMKIKSHDIAAGLAILHEAGGVANDYAGGDDMLTRDQIIASNGLIQHEMLSVLRNL
jgi:myo-inositol-1(or 4)-monophosphatase